MNKAREEVSEMESSQMKEITIILFDIILIQQKMERIEAILNRLKATLSN